VYDENKKVHHFHDYKLDMLAEIVKDAESPILCAYSYKHDIPRLKKRFPKATFLTDDKKIIKKWNAGKIPLLFCHPASAGHGLNLQFGGNVLVWFGLTWSLELYWQFIYRLRRRGQKGNRIIVNHLTIKDSIEDRLITALNTKGITQQTLLDTLRIDA
jgi:SNF2 family DNA or RNA helicase